MKCDRCGCQIGRGEEATHLGRPLCEDCYMDALSPARPCDPWAVYSAKSMSDENAPLTTRQKDLLTVLGETNGMEMEAIALKLGITIPDLQREIATLRHMEKIRATLVDDKKKFRLW